jgi:hypothetical protein
MACRDAIGSTLAIAARGRRADGAEEGATDRVDGEERLHERRLDEVVRKRLDGCRVLRRCIGRVLGVALVASATAT